MLLERRNAYFCPACHHVTITVDVDSGTTPMFISCPSCNSSATSFFFNIPGCMRFTFSTGKAEILPADFEWYKPKSLRKLSKSEREYVKAGGLLMRKRTDAEPIMYESPPKIKL